MQVPFTWQSPTPARAQIRPAHTSSSSQRSMLTKYPWVLPAPKAPSHTLHTVLTALPLTAAPLSSLQSAASTWHSHVPYGRKTQCHTSFGSASEAGKTYIIRPQSPGELLRRGNSHLRQIQAGHRSVRMDARQKQVRIPFPQPISRMSPAKNCSYRSRASIALRKNTRS